MFLNSSNNEEQREQLETPLLETATIPQEKPQQQQQQQQREEEDAVAADDCDYGKAVNFSSVLLAIGLCLQFAGLLGAYNRDTAALRVPLGTTGQVVETSPVTAVVSAGLILGTLTLYRAMSCTTGSYVLRLLPEILIDSMIVLNMTGWIGISVLVWVASVGIFILASGFLWLDHRFGQQQQTKRENVAGPRDESSLTVCQVV